MSRFQPATRLRFGLVLLLVVLTAWGDWGGLTAGLVVLGGAELLIGAVRLSRLGASAVSADHPRAAAGRPARSGEGADTPTYDTVVDTGRFAGVAMDLTWSRSGRREYDRTLRVRLREIAAVRLLEGHGIDLDRDLDAARAVLGSDVLEALDTDGDEAEYRVGAAGNTPGGARRPGPAAADLEPVVARLERL